VCVCVYVWIVPSWPLSLSAMTQRSPLPVVYWTPVALSPPWTLLVAFQDLPPPRPIFHLSLVWLMSPQVLPDNVHPRNHPVPCSYCVPNIVNGETQRGLWHCWGPCKSKLEDEQTSWVLFLVNFTRCDTCCTNSNQRLTALSMCLGRALCGHLRVRP
jgi:hypothetical protein